MDKIKISKSKLIILLKKIQKGILKKIIKKSQINNNKVDKNLQMICKIKKSKNHNLKNGENFYKFGFFVK